MRNGEKRKGKRKEMMSRFISPGLIFATIDVNVVSKLNHPRALVARYVYFTVPTVGIFMSYFSMQAVAR